MKPAPDDRRLLILPGRVEDLDRIVAIEQESFATPWSRKMLEVELEGKNPFSRFLTARWRTDGPDGEVVGYIGFWIVFDELRVMNVAVAPEMRRRGIARALVERAMAAGREGGAERALLEVRASNEGARRLYERLGFRQVALRRRYYTQPDEDAVLMEKESLEESVNAQSVLLSQTGGGEC